MLASNQDQTETGSFSAKHVGVQAVADHEGLATRRQSLEHSVKRGRMRLFDAGCGRIEDPSAYCVRLMM
jgi:hypothetical protein